ncbi:hypothetical protein Ciccas_012713 [Cichlidogyrus casuarinus]|uniref:Odorant receptor n=1 Tax=Cichlidogyrus casuarinus TaxID=1844966 RepID=A0ABD2PPF4_9PLAT
MVVYLVQGLYFIPWTALLCLCLITLISLVILAGLMYWQSDYSSAILKSAQDILILFPGLFSMCFLRQIFALLSLTALLLLQVFLFFHALTIASIFVPIDEQEQQQLCKKMKLSPMAEYLLIPFILLTFHWLLSFTFGFYKILASLSVFEWYHSPVPDTKKCSGFCLFQVVYFSCCDLPIISLVEAASFLPRLILGSALDLFASSFSHASACLLYGHQLMNISSCSVYSTLAILSDGIKSTFSAYTDSLNLLNENDQVDIFKAQCVISAFFIKLRLCIFFSLLPLIMSTFTFIVLPTTALPIVLACLCVSMYAHVVLHQYEQILDATLLNYAHCEKEKREDFCNNNLEVMVPFRHEKIEAIFHRNLHEYLSVSKCEQKSNNSWQSATQQHKMLLSDRTQLLSGSLLMVSQDLSTREKLHNIIDPKLKITHV